MRIAVRNFQARPTIDLAVLCRVVETVLVAVGTSADAVSFAFVDDRMMSDSHGRYLGQAVPTDVLAFPAEPSTPDGERDLGDVIVCTDQAARQARALGHGYCTELAMLALHGLLHLLGYDHTRDGGEMRALEERLRPRILRR